MSFTLFVILPSEDVCSLRNLHSGTSVRAVRKRLELTAGLPAQTYRLTCPQGQLLHEDHVLRLDANVWDGFIMRAQLLESWKELYDHIVANEVDDVIQHGAVHIRKGAVVIDGEEEGKVESLVKERGVVALFISSFLGMADMCKALLTVGVNPNGKTPFGRTPLFAAVARDNDHVMELLLSHRASLEARDVDGVTAVDVSRRLMAKQCTRKIRHMQLQTRCYDNGSATGSRSLYSASRMQGPGRTENGFRVIRIPSGASESSTVRDSSTPSAASRRPQPVRLFRESSFTAASQVSTGADSLQRGRLQADARQRNGITLDFRGSGLAPSTKSRQGTSNGGEVYTWENHTNNVSRSPSAAGTQARMPSPSMGTPQLSNGKSSPGLGRSYGVSWNDSVSVCSSPRMLPFRPKVNDLTVSVPSRVITATTTSATVKSMDRGDTNGAATTAAHAPRPSALYKYYMGPGFPHNESQQVQHDHGPHVPSQEPPERPPSRLDSHHFSHAELKGDSLLGKFAGDNSLLGSQEALSIGSAPELQTTAGLESLGAGQHTANHPDSDDDGGRVLTSRGTATRSSVRNRSRMLVSRQKQKESWRTMKRRIKLAEEQKRTTTKPKHKPKTTAQKETFEEWLDRKRREERQNQSSSGSSDDESDDDDDDADDRSAENTQAFNDWLKDLKERQKSRPQTATPASLHRKKSRPLKDLIQIGAVADPKADPAGYISAFREWQQGRSPATQIASPAEIKEAKRQLEEKRKQLLAMALTYEDWLEHTEERKQLMNAILRADLAQLATIEQQAFRTRRAPRQISFTQWREKVNKREQEIRQHRQRMRREAEQQPESLADMRSSAAVAHEEWVRRKREETLRNRGKGKKGREAEKGAGNRDDAAREKQTAWEAWLERKHKGEVAELDKHLRQERQLLLSMRQKKPPTVTQC